MNHAVSPFTSFVVALAMLLGGLGAALAFDRAAGTAGAPAAVVAPSGSPAPGRAARAGRDRRHRVQVRWAPCRAGSRLEAGVCVTDVVRTVTRPVSAVRAPVATLPVTPPRSTTARGGEDGGEHEHGEEREGPGDD